MARLYLLLLLLSLASALPAQEHLFQQPEGRFHAVGMNATPLLVQFIPFNRSNPKVLGPYFITYRAQKLNGRAFRLALGWDVNANGFSGDESNNHFNFRIGTERRRPIHERWSYSMGWDVGLSAGDFNLPGEKDGDSGFLGLGPTWGFEFFLTPVVSLSTEVSLWLGLGLEDGEARLQVVPPVALYLNVWRKRKR